MINKLEQKRQDLLEKYKQEIIYDYFGYMKGKEEVLDYIPEFYHLCLDSAPEFAIRVLESLYGKNKLEILK